METWYWKISPGSKGQLWPEQRDEGVIAIGWNDIGDMRKYDKEKKKDKIRFEKRFRKLYEDSPNQLWRFYTQIEKRDKIIACNGKKVVGIGTVVGNYKYKNDLEYRHCYPVRWTTKLWVPMEIKKNKRPTIVESDEAEFNTIKTAASESPFKNKKEWNGITRAPTTEQEVIVLFVKMGDYLKPKIVKIDDVSSTGYPDAFVRVKQGKRLVMKKVEFERNASGFESHREKYKKDKTSCDWIVCWENDWKKKTPKLFKKLKIISLKDELQKIRRGWK